VSNDRKMESLIFLLEVAIVGGGALAFASPSKIWETRPPVSPIIAAHDLNMQYVNNNLLKVGCK